MVSRRQRHIGPMDGRSGYALGRADVIRFTLDDFIDVAVDYPLGLLQFCWRGNRDAK